MSVQPPPADPHDEGAILDLMRQAAFPGAVRHLCRRFLALHRDVRIHKAISDEGRYLVSQFVISLHASHRQGHSAAPLTRGSLVRRCLGFGVMSHGRIDAMIGLLRHAGRLVDAPAQADRRSRALLPSAALENEFRERARFHLEALEMLRPNRPWLGLLGDDPDFFWELEHERGQLIAEQPSLRIRLPGLIALAHIEGGYLVMMALLEGLEQPTRPGMIALAQAELAQALGLPRTQLRRVLRALDDALLIRLLPARRQIVIEQLAIDTMMAWHAIRLLRFDFYAAAAMAARDARNAPASPGARRPGM